MKKRLFFQCGIGLFSLLAGSHGFAQQTYLGLAGTQSSSEASYTYAGVILPLGGAKVGQGLYHKTIASWLTYEYLTTQNNQEIEIRARSPGIETGFGYAWTGESYGLDLSATVGYRNQRVRPIVPSGERTGDIFTLNPQLQARYQFTPSFDGDLIANYAFGQRSSFNRLRLGWKPAERWRVGAEGIWQAGRNYRIQQQGLFAVGNLENGLALEISGGQAKPRNESGSPYLGLALAKVF